MWRRLRARWTALGRRDRFEREMAEELRFHLDERAADLVREGMSPATAARRARQELGSVDAVREDCRQARGLALLDELRAHLAQAGRRLRQSPGFTLAAVLTLALCLGANLTLFAAVDAVLLRPLPFPASDRLVRVYNSYPKANVPDDGCSLTNYYERRGQLGAFSSIAAYREGVAIVGERGATERVPVLRVTPDFFATLGRGPVLGRGFVEEETRYGSASVVVLTDGYWRQRLQADPTVVGRRLRVGGASATVIGVLPGDFSFLSSEARLLLPLASEPAERGPGRRHAGTARMIARLAAGATLAGAQSQVDAHNRALAADDAEGRMMADAGFRSLVVPLRADHVAAVRPMLLLMQAGAAVLLAIAAVNLVNLLLIRASGRAKELLVRQALGARRRHVVVEVLMETTLLTLGGGALGLLVGAGGMRLLAALGAARLPLGARIAFDGRLVLVGVAGALALGLVMGVPVAWFQLRARATATLAGSARGVTAGPAAQRLRHAFLVAQIALSFVLLTGAGLLGLSFEKVLAQAPGFRPDHVLSARLSLPGSIYPYGAVRVSFVERMLEALDRQPGVVAAGVVTNAPFGGIDNKSAVTVEGQPPRRGESPRGHYTYAVDGDYFAALGLPLREGRLLTTADSHHAQRVCVVDEDFARHYWPRGGALGKRLFEGGEEGSPADAFTVVGVVGAVRHAALTEDGGIGAVYYPYAYRPDDLFVVVRTSVPPTSLAPTLRRVVRALDPELPVDDVRAMDERIADSLVARRSPALLATLFSCLAALLSGIGTYGVLAYAVSQRRREIALRRALGAQPRQVRRQFLVLAWRLVGAGAVLGLVAACVAGRALQAILFHVPALHLATLAATGAVLTAICLLACLLPSLRAGRVPPLEALAGE